MTMHMTLDYPRRGYLGMSSTLPSLENTYGYSFLQYPEDILFSNRLIDHLRMDKYEVRRQNFLYLINSQFKGVAAAFARKIDKDSTYVGRCLYEAGKKGKKNIGDDMVEAVCSALGYPPGWLDVPQWVKTDNNVMEPSFNSRDFDALIKSGSGQFRPISEDRIPVLNREQAKNWKESIKRFNPKTDEGMNPVSFEKIVVTPFTFLFKVSGDSMAPEFKDGEMAVINPELGAEHGKYVLAEIAGDVVIRRVWQEVGICRLLPIHKNFDPIPMEEAKIIGRVVNAFQPTPIRSYM